MPQKTPKRRLSPRPCCYPAGLFLGATPTDPVPPKPTATEDGLEVAIFAGGCFWCVESDFDKVPGVVRTVSGYTGGALPNPTYKQVSAGGTGHLEAVQIFYDPKQVAYETLVDIFWRSVDPTDGGGQFCDRGESYQTAIFANSLEQKQQAETSKGALGPLRRPEATGRHADRDRRAVLSGGGLPSELLQRRVRCATGSTAIDAAATRGSKNSGAKTPTAASWDTRSHCVEQRPH